MFKKFIFILILGGGVIGRAFAVGGCDEIFGNKCPANGGAGSAWKNYTVDTGLNEEMCGVRAYNDATGVKYMYTDGDDMCVCNIADDPHMNFYWGVGCYCDDGYYTADSSSTNCTKCPSGYPLSDGFRIDKGYASNWGNYEDVCYRKTTMRGKNVSVAVQEYTYGDAFILGYECDNGYYADNDGIFKGEYDPYDEDDNDAGTVYECAPVGVGYYSAANNTRKSCPTYVNAAGETLAGNTAGYGDGADAITDCAIPETETFSDPTGVFVYAGGCKYSQ